MGQTSYQWQDECLECWIERGGRGMLQAVTGSGKTRLELCANQALEQKIGRDVLVKIVVPTSALMHLENGEAVLLIADECHHYASGENQLIFEFLPRIDPAKADYYSLGLPATLPSEQDGRVLAEALGPRIYSYGMRMASAMKTVCPFDVFIYL